MIGRLTLRDDHARLGPKHRDVEAIADSLDFSSAQLLLVVDKAEDVSASVNELENPVHLLDFVPIFVGLENFAGKVLQRGRGPLRRRPEGKPVRADVVRREVEEQLSDLIVMCVLETLSGELDAGLLRGVHHGGEAVFDLGEGTGKGEAVGVLFLESHEVGLPFFEELAALERPRDEELLEVLSGPHDAMVEQVGEVLEGAHGDALLGGVDAVTVALGLVGDDHLGVAHRSEGAGLEERLLEENALRVNVFSGFHIVEGVEDTVDPVPELLVEDLLRVG